MGHRLRKMDMGDGVFMAEKACENYKCRSCGSGMISVNFVNGICIQVFVSHGAECTFYDGNPAERTVEVACDTCKYYSEGIGCVYEGEINSSIACARTNAV